MIMLGWEEVRVAFAEILRPGGSFCADFPLGRAMTDCPGDSVSGARKYFINDIRT
jgi:hypothetical protein